MCIFHACMHVSVYVCVCLRVYVCVCKHTCLYVQMSVYLSVNPTQSDVCIHASHTYSHLCTYAGLLLTHIDELLLYADVDASEGIAGSKYALAEQLLPHLEFYVSRLDMVCLCLCLCDMLAF